jgi:hypothetical protein
MFHLSYGEREIVAGSKVVFGCCGTRFFAALRMTEGKRVQYKMRFADRPYFPAASRCPQHGVE